MTREQRLARLEELRKWSQEQHDEFRDEAFPADVSEQWERAQTEIAEHEQVLRELEQRDARVLQLAGDPEARRESGDGSLVHRARSTAIVSRMSEREVYDLSNVRMNPLAPERAGAELTERALRANELAEYPTARHVGMSQERAKEAVENLIRRHSNDEWSSGEIVRRILATGSPAYRSAFAKVLSAAMSGMPSFAGLNPDEQRAIEAVRALTVGTGAAGGFAVPYLLDPTIVPTSNLSVNPYRAISSVETISGTNEWRGLTSAGVSASYATEALEASDNSPAFSQPTLTAVRAQCFIPVSIELTQDWAGLQSGLAMLIQDAKDDLEATKFSTGTGTNEPQGVITGATGTTNTAAVATFAVADLYSIETALGARFRPRAQWIANRSIYNRVRQFDTAGGANLWVYLAQGLQNNVPRGGNTGAELIGYSANECSTLSSSVATGQKIAALGDWRYYKIVDRIGMDIEVIPHLFGATSRFPTGQRGFYAFWRNMAKVLDPAGFRVLNVA